MILRVVISHLVHSTILLLTLSSGRIVLSFTTTVIPSSLSPCSIIQTPQSKQQQSQSQRLWHLYNSKDDGSKNIIISPDLSEYFAKQQQQQQQEETRSSSSSSLKTATTTTTKTSTARDDIKKKGVIVEKLPVTTSTLGDNDNDDNDTVTVLTNDNDRTRLVQNIVTQIQDSIEQKSKTMIQDIMNSIQQLQQIQVKSITLNENDMENNEKTVLMKNPKKRSINTNSKTKKGLGKSSSSSTTAVMKSSSNTPTSSSSSSRILQRIIQQQATMVANNNDSTDDDDDDDISYRLLWVGSDDAISTFGTGLHKVPLARLQEVFLSISIPTSKSMSSKKKKKSLSNQFYITGTEVIRILGPFPNIKNTLQGTCTTSKGSEEGTNDNNEVWNIIWDSMIDGTGKELVNETNESRQFALYMLYGDEQIIVASTTTTTNTPLLETTTTVPSSTSILIFVRDMEMENKLISLRVL